MGYQISEALFNEFFDTVYAILATVYLQKHNMSFMDFTATEKSLINEETRKIVGEFLTSYNVTMVNITN